MRPGSKQISKQQKSCEEKSEQKHHNQNLKGSKSSKTGRARSPSPEPDDEPEDWIIISRYAEKGDNNIFSFPLSTLRIDIDDENNVCPLGFPGSMYFISVKELLIEWEDYQAEVCGYIECLNCRNTKMEKEWVEKDRHYWHEDKQLLRFVKQTGRKFTFIRVDNPIFTLLDIATMEIECSIRPMFDENEILPIKNAHITVEIKIS